MAFITISGTIPAGIFQSWCHFCLVEMAFEVHVHEYHKSYAWNYIKVVVAEFPIQFFKLFKWDPILICGNLYIFLWHGYILCWCIYAHSWTMNRPPKNILLHAPIFILLPQFLLETLSPLLCTEIVGGVNMLCISRWSYRERWHRWKTSWVCERVIKCPM